MKIAVVSGHVGITGSLVNLLDFYDYLIRQNHKVIFYCLNMDQFFRNLMKTKRKYILCDIREINGDIQADSIVIDIKSLIVLKKKLKCQKLTIFDNLELTFNLENIITPFNGPEIKDIDIRNNLDRHNFKEYMFLMPPCNHKLFQKKYPELKSAVFFKKINMDVLKTIKTSDNGDIFYRQDEPKNGEITYPVITKSFTLLRDLTKCWDYKGYAYYRRQERAYVEQFGRMIFEFLLLGKKVVFLNKPDEKEDGLNDYWNHYSHDIKYMRKLMEEDYTFCPWL